MKAKFLRTSATLLMFVTDYVVDHVMNKAM